MKNIYNQNLIQLYKAAIMEIKKHLAVIGCDILEEAIISGDSIEMLAKIYAAIPKMYAKFLSFLLEESFREALDQLNFVIKELEKIRSDISDIKETIGSHRNDATITATDFARIQKLDGLAKIQLEDLKDHRTVLEAQNDL